jgi:hypothetical protein
VGKRALEEEILEKPQFFHQLDLSKISPRLFLAHTLAHYYPIRLLKKHKKSDNKDDDDDFKEDAKEEEEEEDEENLDDDFVGGGNWAEDDWEDDYQETGAYFDEDQDGDEKPGGWNPLGGKRPAPFSSFCEPKTGPINDQTNRQRPRGGGGGGGGDRRRSP